MALLGEEKRKKQVQLSQDQQWMVEIGQISSRLYLFGSRECKFEVYKYDARDIGLLLRDHPMAQRLAGMELSFIFLIFFQ